jgi:hypothetical protein
MRIKGGYSLYLPIIIVIIGAANTTIFKKEKCCKRFAAPRLLGLKLPIQSAGLSRSGNRFIPRWRPN